ncbi:MAG: lysine N(6)-hydroxylase/L-ornithine N(5)-oxygenase family protein [Janthinobacterium lividum]
MIQHQTLKNGGDAAELHDLIGIGFGPSNLAMAVRLAEQGPGQRDSAPLKHCFIEQQAEFGWHRSMLLDDSRMQISFLKDLVSLRDPKSHFTFVNYLFEHGRLQDFVNLKTFFPTRIEFHDYLRWVASAFDDQVHYGERVSRIEAVADPKDASRVRHLRVWSRDQHGAEHARVTRALSIGVGGAPNVPAVFGGIDASRVIHSSQYLHRIDARLTDRTKRHRVAVIGGGQSAAEVFIDLGRRFPNVDATLIMRAPALKPADDSPFVNEIFHPNYTDLVYSQPKDARQHLLETFRDTNYSVVDRPLIEHIYELLYLQSVGGHVRHRLLPNRAIESAQDDAAHGDIALRLRDRLGGEVTSEHFDTIVLATGYRRDVHHSLLAGVAEHIGDALARSEVGRDYRLVTPETFQPRIYLQGCCESSHGLSDTLLSVLARRADDIHASLIERAPEPEPAAQARETAVIAA